MEERWRALMEVVLALFASTGVLLTWGLGRRWGRVFPSWLPALGGRPVPLWFPVSFATCAAALDTPDVGDEAHGETLEGDSDEMNRDQCARSDRVDDDSSFG